MTTALQPQPETTQPLPGAGVQLNDERHRQVTCGLCGHAGTHETVMGPFSLEREYFTGVSLAGYEFRLLRCPTCGVIMTAPQLDDKELAPFYAHDYGPHALLKTEVDGDLPVLMKLRNLVTGPCVELFFNRSGTIPMLVRRLLSSALLPRMFRGFPICHPRPKRLLDIGCGDGTFLYQIRNTGCEGIGVEFSNEAAATAARTGLTVKVANIEAEEIPELGVDFDVIRLADVLEHTCRPGRVLRRSHELLAPGGELIITVPNFRSISRRLFHKRWPILHLPFHRYHFDCAVLTTALERIGFEVKVARSKSTLQLLYGVDNIMSARGARTSIVNTLTRVLFTPVDVVRDLLLRGAGDSLEIHAVKSPTGG